MKPLIPRALVRSFICIYVIWKNYSHAGTITSMADFMNEVIL